MPTQRKSAMMRRVEREKGEPIEELLPRLVNEKGVIAAADELGISRGSITYWLQKLGFTTKVVPLNSRGVPNEGTVALTCYVRTDPSLTSGDVPEKRLYYIVVKGEVSIIPDNREHPGSLEGTLVVELKDLTVGLPDRMLSWDLFYLLRNGAVSVKGPAGSLEEGETGMMNGSLILAPADRALSAIPIRSFES